MVPTISLSYRTPGPYSFYQPFLPKTPDLRSYRLPVRYRGPTPLRDAHRPLLLTLNISWKPAPCVAVIGCAFALTAVGPLCPSQSLSWKGVKGCASPASYPSMAVTASPTELDGVSPVSIARVYTAYFSFISFISFYSFTQPFSAFFSFSSKLAYGVHSGGTGLSVLNSSRGRSFDLRVTVTPRGYLAVIQLSSPPPADRITGFMRRFLAEGYRRLQAAL